jgi:hypothetical protein
MIFIELLPEELLRGEMYPRLILATDFSLIISGKNRHAASIAVAWSPPSFPPHLFK